MLEVCMLETKAYKFILASYHEGKSLKHHQIHYSLPIKYRETNSIRCPRLKASGRFFVLVGCALPGASGSIRSSSSSRQDFKPTIQAGRPAAYSPLGASPSNTKKDPPSREDPCGFEIIFLIQVFRSKYGIFRYLTFSGMPADHVSVLPS